jgi:hypothetical protein
MNWKPHTGSYREIRNAWDYDSCMLTALAVRILQAIPFLKNQKSVR